MERTNGSATLGKWVATQKEVVDVKVAFANVKDSEEAS